MNTNNGALDFQAYLGTDHFKSGRREIENDLRGISSAAEREGNKIDATFKNVGAAIGGYLTIQGAKTFISDIVNIRGQFEQLEISFTTMLQSKTKANNLMGELVQFAGTTPFDLKGTAQAAKQLLAYGTAASDITTELRMLGDVAAGVSQPIGDLVYLYGTLKTQGRAYAVDIRQFASRGIPIYAELAKVLKINTDEVQAFVEAGKVGFKEVEQAFKNMTSQGSMFGGGMDAQSKSQLGQIEKLKDAIQLMFNDIGKNNQGLVNNSISGVASLVENYETVGKALAGLVATYGAYKAAVMTVAALQKFEATTIGQNAVHLTAEATARANNARQTEILSASIAKELGVRAASAQASLESMRANVSELSAKRALAIEGASSAATEVAAAQAKVAAAHQSIVASAEVNAAKKLEIAQTKLQITTENAFIARKRASAAVSEFNASKAVLEAAAVNTATTQASLNAMRIQVKELAAKKAIAIENARVAASEVAAAQAKVASVEQSIVASAQAGASKQLEIAQTELQIATEGALIARKEASAAVTTFNAEKTNLETAAKATSTIVTNANNAATVAGIAATESEVAATNLATVSSQRLTAAQALRAAATKRMIAIQAVLDRMMLTNPYVLLTLGIVGATVAIWAMYDGTTELEKAQERINKRNEEATQRKEELKNKTSELLGVIRSETETLYAQISAYDQLQALYPGLLKNMDLEKFKSMDAAEAQKMLNAARDTSGIQDMQSEYDKLIKQIERYTTLAKEFEGKDSGGGLIGTKAGRQADSYREKVAALSVEAEDLRKKLDLVAEAAELERVKALPLQDQIKHYQQIKAELEAQKSPLENSLLLINKAGQGIGMWQRMIDSIRFGGIMDQLNKVNSILTGLNAGPAVKDFNFWDKQQNDATESRKKITPQSDPKQWALLTKQIEEATKAKEQWDTKTKTTKTKKIDIVLPSGSLGEIDRQIKKAEEALSKVPASQTARIEAMHKTLLQLTEQRVEAEKIVEFRTWEETLDMKRRMYEQYENAIAPTKGDSFLAIDQITADKAKVLYADLTKEGENYMQFLKGQIEPLQAKVLSGDISKKELGQLVTLTGEFNTIMGTSTPMEQFTERLDGMKEAAGNTVEYIAQLKAELATLELVPENERDSTWATQAKQLKEGIKAGNKEATQELKAFLQQVRGHEEARLAIVKKYANLRAQAEKSGKDTAAIDKAEKQELAEFAQEANEHFIKLNETIYDTSTRKGLKDRAEDAKKYFESIRNDAKYTKQQVDEAEANATDASRNFRDFDTRQWSEWASIVGNAADEFADMEGALGAIGGLLAGATKEVQNLSKGVSAIGKNADSTNKGDVISSGVGGLFSLIGLVVNARKKRKAVKEQDEYNTLQLQLDLNKSLNEEIRLRTILNENVYVKDYFGRIEDGINAMTDASNKGLDALMKLQEFGEAKNGTKNKIDWGAVGQGAGAGAAAGTAIGTAIGGWALGLGTAIGAVVGTVVGGIVGLFGAMKKDARYSGLFELYPELINDAGEFNDTLAKTLIANDQITDKTKQYLQALIDANDAWKEAEQQITDIVSELTGSLGGELRDALVGAFEEGTSAAEAFANTVEKTLENALSNLIYSAVFSTVFGELQKKLEDSLKGSGQSFQDVFGWFMEQSDELTKQFEDLMEIAKKEGKKKGLDLWDPNDTEARANGQSGQIKALTEETGSLLVGQNNAMRISMAETNELVRQQLFHLATIAHNTRYNSYLESIDTRLARMQEGDGLRANGFGN